MTDDELGRWLDGPLFFEWLIQAAPKVIYHEDAGGGLRGKINANVLGETTARSLHRWKAGGAVDTWGRAYERLMDELDLFDWEVPESIRSHENHRPRLTEPQKAIIKRMHKQGAKAVTIAQTLGISERSVRTYR